MSMHQRAHDGEGANLTELYRSSHGRVSERVSALTPAELAATVPGTPLWTVTDLIAHVAGVASDALLGRLDLEGAGTPQWTATQIAERAGRSIAGVLEEWRDTVAKLDPLREARVVRDLLIHEADLSGALGKAGAPPSDAVAWVLEFALADLGRRIDEGGLAGLAISVDGSGHHRLGPSATGGAVSTTSWELFRSLSGRRSAAQVRRYLWEGDPEPYVVVWNRHGPLPVEDVIEGPCQSAP
jgi:uncharacterized protein (TIGR03083 family)